jgi:GTP cyclohydrolase I
MIRQNETLPDIQKQKLKPSDQAIVLDQVGMRSIEVPILLSRKNNLIVQTSARASAFVNLVDAESRGIHMSRLYKDLQAALGSQVLSFSLLAQVLQQFLLSHEILSDRARVEIQFDALLERKALKSDDLGWRSYPVKMIGELEKGQSPEMFLETKITYSSTCPASAALSRQLIQENFKEKFKQRDLDFKEIFDFLGTSQGIIATPHAQRSEAQVRVQIKPETLTAEALIDLIEEALQTPVQSLVKRSDEQEFAFRNGQNLMFCEDAARRIFSVLSEQAEVLDFVAEVSHLESLHPHDAVCRVSKGLSLKGFE